MIEALTQKLLPILQQRGLRTGALSFLNVCGSIEGGTTTFLVLPQGATEPVTAVKVHRLIDGTARVATEAAVMAVLEAAQPSGFVWPKVLFAGEAGGCAVLAASIVAGTHMGLTLAADGHPERKEFQSHAGKAMAVLSGLARTTRTAQAPDYARVLVDFGAVYDVGSAEKSFLETLRARLPRLSQHGACLVHGDFTRHNLLLDHAGQIAVIDWTDAQARGNPLRDATFFLLAYWLQARIKTGMEGFLDAFRGTLSVDNDYGRAVRSAFIKHAQTLGIPESDAWDLAAMAAMEQALFERAKLRKTAAAGGFARTILHLAAEGGADYAAALNSQYWRHAVPVFAEIGLSGEHQRT